jgi:hypothetical protein
MVFMGLYADKIRKLVATVYRRYEVNKRNTAYVIALSGLVMALIIGAGYRAQVLKERFGYQIGSIAWVLSMASVYTKAPGLYNSEESANIIKNPGEYIYKKNGDPKDAKSSIRTDIGYPFIIRLILNDNIKGVDNIAWHIVRYQLMVDLFIIVILFVVGMRIFGTTAAVLSAFLYAVFKIPMVQMSFVEYYYWPVPLSALCLLGLTFIFNNRKDRIELSWPTLFIFFGYGLLIGFATFIRLIFLNLSFVLLPALLLRELFIQNEASFTSLRKRIIPAIKKSFIVFMAVLVGQMVFVLPICSYNKHYHGKFALSDRQFWHLPLQGIGIYKNTWGIKDSGDVSINEWAMERGAPSYMGQPEAVIERAEIWHREKYFELVKENPQFFINNFIKHFTNGLTVSEGDFRFYGFFSAGSTAYKWFVLIYPWLVLSALGFMFFLSRKKFWIALAVLLQGLYLLLIVVTWFCNYVPFINGYIPVFVLLLAIALAVHLKIIISFLESILRCWLKKKLNKQNLLDEFVNCYNNRSSM